MRCCNRCLCRTPSRAHSLIQTYVESVGADGTYSNVRGTSGYEALRILAKEFSLWSRAEASFFRADFVKKSYKGDTAATYISDAVRKMDVDLSRYRKLIDTLPHTVSRDGLEIQSADLTLIFIRSLPRRRRVMSCTKRRVKAITSFGMLR